MQRTISLTLLGFESLLQTAKNIFFVAFLHRQCRLQSLGVVTADFCWFSKTTRLAGGSKKAFAVEQSRRSGRLPCVRGAVSEAD